MGRPVRADLLMDNVSPVNCAERLFATQSNLELLEASYEDHRVSF